MRGLLSFVTAAAVTLPLTAGAQPHDRPTRTGGGEQIGEAERLGGPLRPLQRPLRRGASFVTFSTMMVGPATTARPEEPVEAWFWIFSEKELQVSVPGVEFRYDSMAMRYRVDCAAGTIQLLRRESYRNGVLVRVALPQTKAEKSNALTRSRFNAVCEPGFTVDAPTFDDHRAARTAYLARSEKRRGSADDPAAAAKPARTGEAERAGGPLRLMGVRPGAVFMLAGAMPSARPSAPVEVWSWSFYRDEREAAGRRHDATAERVRLDCDANTLQRLTVEIYRGGDFEGAEPSGDDPAAPKPGTVGQMVMDAVCGPNFLDPKAQTFSEHRAARVEVSKAFARLKAKKTKAKLAAAVPESKDGSAVRTGEAERSGPLRWVGQDSARPSIIAMVSGPRPVKRPAAPVEVWAWTFWREERGGGDLRTDAVAVRMRVDCAAGTTRSLATEAYPDGMFAAAEEAPGKAVTPPPGALGHIRVRMVCEPGFGAKARTFPDHRAARAAARKLFAGGKGGK